jgi:hypothetical protein
MHDDNFTASDQHYSQPVECASTSIFHVGVLTKCGPLPFDKRINDLITDLHLPQECQSIDLQLFINRSMRHRHEDFYISRIHVRYLIISHLKACSSVTEIEGQRYRAPFVH